MDASNPNRTTFIIALAWPIVVGAAGGYWLDQRAAQRIEEATAEMARVAVIDSVAFMQGSAQGGTPNERAAAGLAKARATADRLSEAGYVVLDRNVVVATPESLMVRP